MSEFLNPQEITALTGYVMPSKQADWLKSKSIPHKIDGARVIVATAHTRAWLEGRIESGEHWQPGIRSGDSGDVLAGHAQSGG